MHVVNFACNFLLQKRPLTAESNLSDQPYPPIGIDQLVHSDGANVEIEPAYDSDYNCKPPVKCARTIPADEEVYIHYTFMHVYKTGKMQCMRRSHWKFNYSHCNPLYTHTSQLV